MSDDAMADFLAREKAALGDDADFFTGSGNANSTSAPSDSAPSAFPDFDEPSPSQPPSQQQQPPQPQGIDAFPSLDSPSLGGAGAGGSSNVRVTGYGGTGDEKDEEMDKFQSAFPDLSGEVPYQAPSKPVFNALSSQPYGSSPYPPSAAAGGSANGDAPRTGSILPAPQFSNILPSTEEDTEPIKAWRAKQNEEIKRRDEADRKRREEMSDKAEKAIDGFYEGYNKLKEKNIRENKEQEAAFLEQVNEGIAKGTAWERITDMIALENSQSKTIRPSVPGGSDLARMKEILLALRREGEKAPGAAGF